MKIILDVVGALAILLTALSICMGFLHSLYWVLERLGI